MIHIDVEQSLKKKNSEGWG